MKIKLEYPFTLIYKSWYILTNKEDREIVVLYKNKYIRTTIQYAKYLMSINAWRILWKNEQVDHIDWNKKNNSINNLQILSEKEHIKKTKQLYKKKFVKYYCPVCNDEFIVKHWNSNLVDSKTNQYIFCSKKCFYSSKININKSKYKNNKSYFIKILYL